MVRRLTKCERAATAVEFALLLPVMLAFLLGIIEFGRAIWIRQTLQYAVESASRTAMVDSTMNSSAISSAVTANLLGLQGVAPVVVVVTSSTQVSITASYDFTFLVPNLLPFGPITLTAQSKLPR
ncbi:MAG: pilus assembly protein [Phaeospirillum sp.]|nr:pilus assembly protein [Phaeospirillum sp.]